ncbi:DUF6799 domain-containing protein [Rufibacter psychrotolerans]|uniref:DUF6799 domain-containing protein n=1 Tax=Rufibacter psychrotolerans TaxID=2812556 RepID=UPI001967E0F9|nr:DUF6799 domain-containing protein [Rufibacter sp. SYSU D00308]
MKGTLLFFLAAVLLGGLPRAASAQVHADSLITRANIKDNTIFWHQGKLVQHRGGKLYEVQEPVQYGSGTIVSPSGQVRLPNGRNYVLKQKNAVSPQGHVVLVADDIFTHEAIVQHETQTVGDTETRILVVDGQVVSAGNNKQKVTYTLPQEREIQLLEQMVKLLEQRTALLEANLSPAERSSIKAYHEGLNKQLAALDQQLQALPTTVKR